MALDRPDLRSIRSVLDALSHLPKITYCPDCGYLIEQRNATLSLKMTGEARDLVLPFCGKCDSTWPTYPQHRQILTKK
jgi:RNase P subunit RPR2